MRKGSQKLLLLCCLASSLGILKNLSTQTSGKTHQADTVNAAHKRLATPAGPALMEDIGGGHFLIPAAAADYHGAEDELPDLEMNHADAYRSLSHNQHLQQIWDNGNAQTRAKAGLKFRPSTTSDHLYGRAVDQSPRFFGDGELAHRYLEVMARHNFYYDTPGDVVHLGYYEGGIIRPEKKAAIERLRQAWEDRAGYGTYEAWRSQNGLPDDPQEDPDDYDYYGAYLNHIQFDADNQISGGTCEVGSG